MFQRLAMVTYLLLCWTMLWITYVLLTPTLLSWRRFAKVSPRNGIKSHISQKTTTAEHGPLGILKCHRSDRFRASYIQLGSATFTRTKTIFRLHYPLVRRFSISILRPTILWTLHRFVPGWWQWTRSLSESVFMGLYKYLLGKFGCTERAVVYLRVIRFTSS